MSRIVKIKYTEDKEEIHYRTNVTYFVEIDTDCNEKNTLFNGRVIRGKYLSQDQRIVLGRGMFPIQANATVVELTVNQLEELLK